VRFISANSFFFGRIGADQVVDFPERAFLHPHLVRIASVELDLHGSLLARESAQVFRKDRHWNSSPRRLSEHLEDGRGGSPVDPDAGRALKRFGVGPPGTFHDSQVVLEGVGVGMDLDVRDFGAVVIDELMEGDQSRFVGGDVVDPPRDSLLFRLELPRGLCWWP
jgi:hypothetical protein